MRCLHWVPPGAPAHLPGPGGRLLCVWTSWGEVVMLFGVACHTGPVGRSQPGVSPLLDCQHEPAGGGPTGHGRGGCGPAAHQVEAHVGGDGGGGCLQGPCLFLPPPSGTHPPLPSRTNLLRHEVPRTGFPGEASISLANHSGGGLSILTLTHVFYSILFYSASHQTRAWSWRWWVPPGPLPPASAAGRGQKRCWRGRSSG